MVRHLEAGGVGLAASERPLLLGKQLGQGAVLGSEIHPRLLRRERRTQRSVVLTRQLQVPRQLNHKADDAGAVSDRRPQRRRCCRHAPPASGHSRPGAVGRPTAGAGGQLPLTQPMLTPRV